MSVRFFSFFFPSFFLFLSFSSSDFFPFFSHFFPLSKMQIV